MSKLIVTVEKIIDIQPIPNADRVVLATVKGWSSIIQKDSFKVGDLCIYVPIDSVLPEKLIEEQKLTFLKGHGRVTTVKLRGTISQGLILPMSLLPNPNGDWEGQDVANRLGITKYEPTVKSVSQPKESVRSLFQKLIEKKITLRRFVSKSIGLIYDSYFKPRKRGNPNFKEYTDIQNQKHYPVLFTEGEEVVITEKIHGCLNSQTDVLLFNGTTKKIKDIVDNKLNVLLASRNSAGKIVPSRIINWFHNGYTKQWKKITFDRKGLFGNKFGKIICTPYHQFLNVKDDEFYQADCLKAEDEIYVSQLIFNIPNIIKDVLIGKMLGDASFDKGHNSLSFGHKEEHKDYVLHTLSYLGFMAGNLQKLRISGFGTRICRARTKSDESIKRLFSHWFINGDKQVPPIKLSPISLAFWYMDDGSLSHHPSQKDRANFATCGFNENSVDNLIIALKEIGLDGVKYLTDSYWRIRLNTDSAYKMFYMIAPYMPKCMRYKLPEELRDLPEAPIHTFNKEQFKTVLTIQKILSIEDYNNSKDSTAKYDLETEYHNYIANGVVVHNSNFRAGCLPRNPSLIDKWFHFTPPYEFVYGSHTVQKMSNSGPGFYGEDVYGKAAEMYKLKDVIPPGYTVYGEIFGENKPGATIQKGFGYGVEKIEVAFFDVKFENKYLDWAEFKHFCDERKLPIVPVLYQGPFSTDKLKECTDGNTIVGFTFAPKINQIREGCVVKPIKETYSNQAGRKILKSVSAEYLLLQHKNKTDETTEYQH